MVGISLRNSVKWFAPAPLWARQSTAGLMVADEAAAARPSILRFANDQFMEEFLELLEDDPTRVSELLVQPETWRKPGVGGNPTAPKARESAIANILNRTKIEADGRRVKRPVALIRNPDKVAPPSGPQVATAPLKLYQPAHQRHYLVSASLISREAGLPDQSVALGEGERAAFVTRRLTPPAGTDPQTVTVPDGSWDEYAFVVRGKSRVWHRVGNHLSASSRQLLPNEDRNALFPVAYPDECGDRRLHAGVIPVGKREQYMAAAAEGVPSPRAEKGSDPAARAASGVPFENRSLARWIFQVDVGEPWKALINQAQYRLDALSRAPDNFGDLDGSNAAIDRDRVLRTMRDQIQTGSWYVILDLARYLQEFIPNVWAGLDGRLAATELSPDERTLLGWLEATRVSGAMRAAVTRAPAEARLTVPPYAPGSVKPSLAEALLAIGAHADDLEAVENAFSRYDDQGNRLPIDPRWPSFLFPLADPEHGGPVPPSLASSELTESEAFEQDKERIDALADLVERLASGAESDPAPTGSELAMPQSQLDHKHAWFVIRCVYERPHCGPLFAPLLSNPTRMFEMAPFFDPDAPARPVRIPMPVDVTPAGLRKYNKNAAFVLSDMLCGGVKRMKKYTFGDLVMSVLPWPFHRDLPDPGETGPCKDASGLEFGMICSLSIPIVTLCAFILLIIMVTLFDLFFRWIPYLMLCLPIPGLKSK